MNYKITTQSSLRALQKAGRSNPVINLKIFSKDTHAALDKKCHYLYGPYIKSRLFHSFNTIKFIVGLLRPAFCRARNDAFGDARILKKQVSILLFKHNFFLKLTPMRLRGNDDWEKMNDFSLLPF